MTDMSHRPKKIVKKNRARVGRDFEEERGCLRAAVCFAAQYQTAGDWVTGVVRDISRTGLCLETTKALPMNSVVAVKFEVSFAGVSRRRPIAILLRGRVARPPEAPTPPYLYGIAAERDAAVERSLQQAVLELSLGAAQKRLERSRL